MLLKGKLYTFKAEHLAAGWPDVQVQSYLYLLGATRSPRLIQDPLLKNSDNLFAPLMSTLFLRGGKAGLIAA